MSEPASPTAPFYVTGGTLKPGAPSYVERQADTDLIESLQAGEFCYVLTARQMGKSSLMARTAKRLEEDGVCTAIVDLSQIGTERGAQAAAQWYFGIAHEIHRQLKIDQPLRPWWREWADLPPLQRLASFFRDVVLGHCPGRVVVFVDEIDSTIGLPFADDFFAALRACFNARATETSFERLTFALFGVATPDQLIKDQARTPFNIGRRLDLTDFTPDEAMKLEIGLHSDPAEAPLILERVLYWTGGHPYLTQVVCRAVRERNGGGVDLCVEELFLSSRAQREETNLKHARARLEQPGPEKRRLLQLLLRVRQGKAVRDQPSSPIFAQLKLTGVVKGTSEGQLAVRNRVYESVFSPRWVKASIPADQGRQLAWATVATSLALALIWYGVFQPRQAEEAFKAAIKDDGYNSAIAAYNDLHSNPFSRSRAPDLMQQFWEQRALRQSLAGQRDESLLSYLQALSVKESESLRRCAANRVGSDYERLRFTLRFSSAVYTVAFSPDGSTVLTGSEVSEAKGAPRLWDARSGKPIATLTGHEAPVYAVAFSLDGNTVLTGSDDKTARLWDARSGKPIATLSGHKASVYAVAFSPDGSTILTGSSDNTARLWGARSGKPIATLAGHQDTVGAVSFSPDGKSVVTGSSDHTARLWDAHSGKPLSPPLQHQGPVSVVAFSPDGRSVVTGSSDHTARLWDAHSGKSLSPPLQHQGPVSAVVFSPDGRSVVTGSSDETARLWDAHSGSPLSPPLQHQDAVRAVAFSPDGQSVVTGSSDETARLWDAHSGSPLSPPLQHQDAVRAVAFSPDGQSVLTWSGNAARLWDTQFGKPISPFLQYQGYVGVMAFSRDGRAVVTGSWDNTARLWDMRTGQPISPPLQHQGRVDAVAFSPDGRAVVTGSWDNTARLWDARTGHPISPPLQHQGQVDAVAFSPDGRALVTGSYDSTARFWDGRSGTPISPPLQLQGAVLAVAFSPEGHTVVTGYGNNVAQVWATRSGKPISPPLRHRGPVLAVAFSPDGRTVVTGDFFSNARLWDVPSGELISPPLRHQDDVVYSVAFSPDGKRLFVATSHWLSTYSWDGKTAAPQNSQLLHGFWKKAFRFPSDCQHCLQVALGSGNSLLIETLNLDVPNDPPIQGDPKELLEKWRERLGLKFDEKMNLVPRYGAE